MRVSLFLSFHLPVCPFLFDRVYKTQNRPDKAVGQCEKSLQLLRGCDQPEKMISVYRDMAAAEQDRARSDRAVEHLTKASGPGTAPHEALMLMLMPFVCVCVLGSRPCHESLPRGAGGG